MKIGYICNQHCCVSGASNGVRMQALIWRDALLKQGHDVELISSWGNYNWKSFNVIHSFGFGSSLEFIEALKNRGLKIVCSPIIDTVQNKFAYKIASRWGSQKLRLTSPGYNLRQKSKYVDMFLARSEFEAGYLEDCLDIPRSRIKIVPLSYRCSNEKMDLSLKEDFCFHVSSITQPRKNVMRLIQAASKYKFKLVLAGSTGTPSSFAPFKKIIDSNDNIESLGFITDDELENYYMRSKVFALPSLNEGVGLVALEAAVYGCGIVITNVGGPSEYYPDEMSYKINPLSVDEIGKAIIAAMSNPHQPELDTYIKDKYSLDKIVIELVELYKSL